MAKSSLLFCIVLIAAVVVAGCSSTVRTTSTTAGRGSTEVMPAPDPDDTFDYLASNDNCNCEEYTAKDRLGVEYTFRANYKVDTSIVTNVVIEFHNRHASDTLHLDPGVIRIASRNISYQHNNRFLPLPDMVVAPGKSDKLELNGHDVQGSTAEWNKIAGEQLTITLKGMRLGKHSLEQQSVTLIPQNPRMKR